MEELETMFEDVFSDAADTNDGSEISENEEVAAETAAEPEGQETTEPEGEKPAEPEGYNYAHLRTKAVLDKASVESIATALGSSPEDVVAALQKGADYDHLRKNYDAKSETLKKFAKMNNVPEDRVAEFIEQINERIETRRLYDDAKAQNPQASEDLLAKYVALQRQVSKNEAERQNEERARNEEESHRRPWVDLFMRFPELTPDNIPKEVVEGVNSGLSPSEAYLQHQLNAKDIELKRAIKETENKTKAVGSVSGEIGTEKADPFIEAFDSVFNY